MCGGARPNRLALLLHTQSRSYAPVQMPNLQMGNPVPTHPMMSNPAASSSWYAGQPVPQKWVPPTFGDLDKIGRPVATSGDRQQHQQHQHYYQHQPSYPQYGGHAKQAAGGAWGPTSSQQGARADGSGGQARFPTPPSSKDREGRRSPGQGSGSASQARHHHHHHRRHKSSPLARDSGREAAPPTGDHRRRVSGSGSGPYRRYSSGRSSKGGSREAPRRTVHFAPTPLV